MTAAAPFGLYPTRACVAGERLAAGQALPLDTPVVEGGVTRFRRSLWLAVPAAVRGSTALALAGSALALRFAPVTLQVDSDDDAWFERVDTEADDRTAQLHFRWPATVTRLADPFGYRGEPFGLFRVDGDNVADEPTQRDRTGSALNPPWVGSPMRVVMDRALPAQTLFGSVGLTLVEGVLGVKDAPAARAATGLGAAGSAPSAAGAGQNGFGSAAQKLLQLRRSHLVPSLSIAGVPTSPRLKLLLEARGGQPETLLWQALLAGEQGTVTLPAQPVADEWAPALDQLRQRLDQEQPPLDAPLLLRLDVESDAPCALTLTQATLVLEQERELLAGEARADFDGTREQSRPLALAWPAGALQSLMLAGRVGGGTDGPAASGALPGGSRHGLLLQPSSRVRLPVALAAPQRIAGLSIAWHPLAEALTLTLRLLADAGSTASAQPLLESRLTLAPDAPGWLALRTPVLDLQAMPLWIELTIDEGSGLWLGDAAAPPPARGWLAEMAATQALQQPLGVAPAFAWLAPPGDPAQPRQAQLLAGSQLLAAALDERFELACPTALLATLPALGLLARSAAATRVTLQSARARLRVD